MLRKLMSIILAVLCVSSLLSLSQTSPAQATATESAQATPPSEAAVSQVTMTRERTASEVVANLARGAHRRHVSYTWRAYFSGLLVYWYRIDVTWTYNGVHVWDVDSSRQGDGSWGWHYCGSDPSGEQWVGIGRRVKKAFGFGHFGQYPISPGCILGDRILGGSIVVYASGYSVARNGTCCD